MKKTMKLWSEVLTSPSRGFSSFDEKTPLAIAIICVLVLVFISTAIIIPIINSGAYSEAVVRIQINTMKDRGTEMTAEQIEMMRESLTTGPAKKISLISSLAGGVIGYAVMLLITTLLLKVLLSIFKEKRGFKLVLKLMVYIALITAVQMLLKNVITVLTDYERVLSRVQYTKELQYALTFSGQLSSIIFTAEHEFVPLLPH